MHILEKGRMDELEEKLEELENEVIEGMGDNPMRAYKLQFPYTVKFHLADDDNRTEVTINTVSEEMTFARTSKDALHQKERNDAVSKNGYTKHIVNWVAERMYRMDLDECEFSYTGSPDAIEMTDAELDAYAREVISVAE
jgi:hypothetical protein